MKPYFFIFLSSFLIESSTSVETFVALEDPNYQDPRENITAQYNTCDFDLVETLNLPSLVSEYSEQCQEAYRDPQLREILLQESKLFRQIDERILAYETQEDPNCDPFEEGRETPCPAIDFELRFEMHNASDIMVCQNSTGHFEYASCMLEKRNEMLLFLNTII